MSKRCARKMNRVWLVLLYEKVRTLINARKPSKRLKAEFRTSSKSSNRSTAKPTLKKNTSIYKRS